MAVDGGRTARGGRTDRTTNDKLDKSESSVWSVEWGLCCCRPFYDGTVPIDLCLHAAIKVVWMFAMWMENGEV